LHSFFCQFLFCVMLGTVLAAKTIVKPLKS